MKRKRDEETLKIQGLPRSVVVEEFFKLTFPDAAREMDIDEEGEEEGEIEKDKQVRDKELFNERKSRINEMVDCLSFLLTALKERNVHLFIRIIARCGVATCRSLLKQTMV